MKSRCKQCGEYFEHDTENYGCDKTPCPECCSIEKGEFYPCPFCGKQPHLRFESDKIGYYIECECQIHYGYWNLNKAIERWNRRIKNV